MRYEIFPYRSELATEVGELERILWGEDAARNVEHLRWKYEQGPLRDQTYLFLASCDGEVVGARGLVGRCWTAGDGTDCFVAPLAADLVIRPDHRRSGLLRDLTETALEHVIAAGHPFAFNFSAGPVTRLTSLVGGWRDLGAITELGRNARRQTLPKRLLRFREGSFLAFERKKSPSRRRFAGRVTMASVPRPAEMADLLERVPWDGRIREVRKEAHFRWRFANPKACNRFLFLDDGRLEGYLVLQMRKHRESGGVVIVDHQATGDEIAADLLRAAAAWSDAWGLKVWARALSPGARAILEGEGLASREVPRGVAEHRPGILMKEFTSHAQDELARSSGRRPERLDDWDLRSIYSDAH